METTRQLQTKNKQLLVLNIKTEGDINLSENFSLSEFQCNDGHPLVFIDTELLGILEAVRAVLGDIPITVNSGYRTPEWNEKVGGVDDSRHMRGKAADITWGGFTKEQAKLIANLAKLLGARYTQVYGGFIHIDVN